LPWPSCDLIIAAQRRATDFGFVIAELPSWLAEIKIFLPRDWPAASHCPARFCSPTRSDCHGQRPNK
jgi:hypothetical protein